MSQNFFFCQVVVIGVGIMGCGIVMCLVNVGFDVQWLDSNLQMFNQVFGVVVDIYVYNVCQGCIGEEEVVVCCVCIMLVQYFVVMCEVDLVIEVVYENLEFK